MVVTRRSELSDEELAKLSGEHDVHDEQTQIFFSADELDELREIESQPRISLDDLPLLCLLRCSPEASFDLRRTPAAVSDVIMRGGMWSPSQIQQQTPSDRPQRPSGTYERHASPERTSQSPARLSVEATGRAPHSHHDLQGGPAERPARRVPGTPAATTSAVASHGPPLGPDRAGRWCCLGAATASRAWRRIARPPSRSTTWAIPTHWCASTACCAATRP